jgi:WD40 repeat protein
MLRPSYRVSLCVLFVSLLQVTAQTKPEPAQQVKTNSGLDVPCAMPNLPAPSRAPNIFSDEQEEWLGDVIDQTFRQNFHVVEDPDGYLQKLGERLLAQLPPTKMHYRFFIVDAPELNSFGTAGGRIYIFRRIISFTQNEDELAALLGHEIGHIVTHQSAIDFSEWFQELNIRQVGDRQDIFNKWNQLVDNAAKLHSHSSAKREQEEQLVADRIGLYAMARAGYDPTHAVDFLDRLFQTKRKTGGFWSDFFGRTSPEAKRLREVMRNATPLPANCISPLPSDSPAHFASWQKAVVESKIATAKEDVQGVLKKTSLAPQLRGDLHSILFSPDGAYMLAQDESSIFLLSREPLQNLFRIDAPDAHAAQFSPDSHSVVFYDKEFRVEKWDIANKQRASIHQVTLPMQCMQTRLSPTGDVLACMTGEFELQLIDVPKNTVLFSRKRLYQPEGFELYFIELMALFGAPPQLFHMNFSPDGRYFLVGHGRTTLGYDLQTHEELKLAKRIKDLIGRDFTFLSSDRIAGTEFGNSQQKLSLLQFPSGDPIDAFPMNTGGGISRATKGDYALVHGGTVPVGVVDLKEKKAIMGYKSPGFDIYDQWFAGEAVGGEVGVFNISDKKLVANVHLPDSPLGSPRAVAFSPNGKWLAASGPTRGAIWNVETGERMFYTLGFESAYFDQDRFIGEFPKHEKNPPRMFQFDPTDKSGKLLYALPETTGDSPAQVFNPARTWQLGELLMTLAPQEGKQNMGKFLMQAYDVRTKTKLWEKNVRKSRFEFFHSRPGRTVTMLVIDYDAIKAEAREDAALNAKLQAIEGTEGKKDSYVLRVFDAQNGNDLGAVLVDTGKLSFRVLWATTVRDTVLVGDSINRTLVYSLKSGAQKGKILGNPRAISNDGSKMLIETSKGAADLYDIGTLKILTHFTFPSRIVHAEFTAEGNKLMVLTADQSVYQINVEGASAGSQTASTDKLR